jgi:hypothetical protein
VNKEEVESFQKTGPGLLGSPSVSHTSSLWDEGGHNVIPSHPEVVMRKALQILVILSGIAAIFISLLHLVLGPAAIPGGIPVNATMDSEDRFYATLLTAYGVALLWCARGIEQKSKFVYFLAAVFLFGGLARIVSIAVAGLPHPFFLAMLVLEMGLPIIVVLMQLQVTRATPS